MQIEIWSDYACPYCYIGKRNLEKALEKFEHNDKIKIVHKAFELYPQMGKEVTTTTQGRIEQKYGKTPEEAQEMIDHIERVAERVGLEMNYDSVKNTNTFDAHRLTKFAEEKGKANEMNERLFKAYFTDNIALGSNENLLRLSEDIGLNPKEVNEMLSTETYTENVKNDEYEAQQLGVRGVPFFLIGEKIALPGAVSPDGMLSAIKRAWNEEEKQNEQGISCGIDGCEI